MTTGTVYYLTKWGEKLPDCDPGVTEEYAIAMSRKFQDQIVEFACSTDPKRSGMFRRGEPFRWGAHRDPQTAAEVERATRRYYGGADPTRLFGKL